MLMNEAIGHPGERRLPRQHLEQHAPQTVKVAAAVKWSSARLLRTHVRRRPEHNPRIGNLLPRGSRHGSSDPEIAHDRVPRLEEDVLRLDIAVNHTVGVGIPQCASHLAGDL